MAIASQQTETYACSGPGCSTEFGVADAVDGSYCSRRCSLRDSGADVLEHLQHDHRVCHACFRQVKEVQPPPMRAPDHVIGYQYLTEHGQLGDRSPGTISDDGNDVDEERRFARREPEAASPADQLVIRGTICRCGTTDHRDAYQRDEVIVSLKDAAIRLCQALERLGREGQHDKTVDAKALAKTLRQSAEESGACDWRWAVGAGLEA